MEARPWKPRPQRLGLLLVPNLEVQGPSSPPSHNRARLRQTLPRDMRVPGSLLRGKGPASHLVECAMHGVWRVADDPACGALSSRC